jgi:probable HAF family extracellular repeat protein
VPPSGFSITDLGTVGGKGSGALAIAETGQVLGWSTTANGGAHTAVWQDGQATDLGTLGGRSSDAVAINAAGQVLGEAETAEGLSHAVLWSPS